MARNIKFPLRLKDGIAVRTIEELREHFDMESVLGYYANGQLVKWLKNYYYDDIAYSVESLDKSGNDFNRQLCQLLGAEYKETDISVDMAQYKLDKLNKISQLTADENIISKLDQIATTQEELDELIRSGVKEIYLASGEFNISDVHTDIKYFSIDPSNIIKLVNFDCYSVDESNIVLTTNLAEIGSTDAQYQLGEYYYFGDNKDEALKWMKKASESGNMKALDWIYRNYHQYDNADSLKDYWLSKIEGLANQGDPEAQFKLGKYYYRKYNGHGLFARSLRNVSNFIFREQGITWIKKAAEQNYVEAFTFFVDYYLENNNEEEAKNYAFKASEYKDYEGIYLLGNYYRKKRDISNAEILLKLAADNGHIKAKLIFDKYDYYFLGEGIDKSPDFWQTLLGGWMNRFKNLHNDTEE